MKISNWLSRAGNTRVLQKQILNVAFLIAISLLVTACGGSSSGKSENTESMAAATTSSAAAVAVMGDAALDDAIARGQQAYELNSNGCVLCHGVSGQGGIIPTPINNTNDCTTCSDLDALAVRISATMPTDNPAKCGGGSQPGTCSHDVATYMWYSFLGNTANNAPPATPPADNNNGGGADDPAAPADPNDPNAPADPNDPNEPDEPADPNDPVDDTPVDQPAPPPVVMPGANDQDLFAQTVYPLLRNNTCVTCHFGGGIGKPDIAHPDVAVAYQQVVNNQKVNLNNPANSRLVLRLRVDNHFCFGGVQTCEADAMVMQTAIEDWAALAIASAPPPDDGMQRVTSGVTSFAQGQAGSSARVSDSVIALYTFSEGAGNVARDTSGVGTPMDLTIQNMQWSETGGLTNINGKAEATVTASRKLFNLITPVNQYTIEAWIQPENTAQSGPARIVTYSNGTSLRNFTMGQVGSRYAYRNRSSETDNNGTPNLEAQDPPVTTELQHVVMTYHPASGRNVYIDGVLGASEDQPGNLDNWDDGYQFVLGNETTNNRLWKGTFKMVAIHNRALNGAEVQQNFDAGNGTYTVLRFDVSNSVGEPAYIELQAAELDEHSYVFTTPTMVTNAVAVPVRNIRIAVNNSIPVAAQAFRDVDTFVMQSGQQLSPQGAVIPKDLGVDMDQFHLEFELLGAQTGLAEVPAAAAPPAVGEAAMVPDSGIRTFSQVHDTMSVLTGISQGNGTVRNRYEELRDQLPATADMLAFAGAQQIAIQRLAVTYCGEITRSNTRCNNFFGACAVANANDKTRIANLLYDRFIGDGLVNQPARAGVSAEVVDMFDDLACANGCTDDAARTALQATCSAVLSSGAMTIN